MKSSKFIYLLRTRTHRNNLCIIWISLAGMMYVDTKTECRLWACFRPRKICVHNFPYIPETLLRLDKLYHIFRREMQPIKQWKHKQDYICTYLDICGSSTIYIIVKLCLMFNSLFSFMRLKDFFRKPRTSTVYKRTFVHLLCNAKEILTVLTIFSTNNRKSEELKLQSFFSDW